MRRCKIKCQTLQTHMCCWDCGNRDYCSLSCTSKEYYTRPEQCKSCVKSGWGEFIIAVLMLAFFILLGYCFVMSVINRWQL